MRLRGPDFPPVVNCFPSNRVNDCVPGTCNEGFECVDEGPSVRCVISSTDTPSTTAPSPSPDITTTASPSPDSTTATIPPISPECEALRCGEQNRVCEEDENGARCILPSSCEELAPFCRRVNAFSTCVELNPTPTCVLPPNCDLISCREFERCAVVQLIGVLSNQTFIGVCLATIFGASCDELECLRDDDICTLTSVPNVPNSTLAECARPTDLTCESDFFCSSLMNEREDVTCVDLTQDGRLIGGKSCTVLNCELEGCPGGAECVSFTGAPFTSACELSSRGTISYGTTCSDREDACTGDNVCQEAVLNGIVLGSFCGFPQTPLSESCDSVTCDDEVDECSVTTYNTQPEVVRARCLPGTDLFLLFARIYNGFVVVPPSPPL